MNTINQETISLKKRVLELEKQLDHLRLSRRVLMDLLEQVEKEKDNLMHKLGRKTQKNLLTGKNVCHKQGAVLEIKNYLRKS
ncbi:hypothetical protein Sgly_2202 [Syntrophobotulus glycolicus DSM 8271]|uniref:Uncharacterized protein n=1 Tax=Syntrophobotulus glycolicus (strain DSM 8271 / FlGlyR) TaxID=645991 RepID=F0STW8_SYNGF|nr:hypothetical protein [Syntrophobotulus glycolicus]ADY56491.1 hypothetical protein Sgly_2202 [Syntrophobotulus glycolicus DSM 8271]